MKPFLAFGRKVDPGVKLSPDQEIERIEAEIRRLRVEAGGAREEARALSSLDPEQAVELDGRALAAERLIGLLREKLPELYAARREAACKSRDAEIEEALASEQAALRELAKKIESLATKAAEALSQLRELGVPEIMGRAPVGLHGGRLARLLGEGDVPPSALSFRVDEDLRFQLSELEQAADLLKRGERAGHDIFVRSARNASLIPLIHQLQRHLEPFDPPPEAPEPEGEPQPAEEAVP